MKKMKQLLSVFLATMLVIAALPVSTSAVNWSDFSAARLYNSGPNEAEITGYTGTDTEITIPDTVNLYGETYRVVQIDMYAFNDNTTLQKVTIPTGVRTIEGGAFSGCSNLQEVN